MKLPQVLLSKAALTTLLVVACLIAFNSFNSSLESELFARFNEWCPKTLATLDGENASQTPPSKVKITIGISGPLASSSHSPWSFPAHSLADATERSQTARVLQLISESKVFGLPSVKRQREGDSYLSISITDEGIQFDSTVSMDEVKESIQLQNLLKLLEVYALTPPTPINPAQL